MRAQAEKPQVLAIVHDLDDNLNELAVPLVEAGLGLVTWDVQNDFSSMPSLESLGAFSGIVSLGAHAGVLDEPQHEWMRHERSIMELALEQEIPLLGLCFGAQLLASVAGGEFRASPVAEVGWTRVSMSPEARTDAVFSALDDEIDAFHFHYDSYTLPQSVAVLGETDGIIQAFRVGGSAWATQFHLEVGLNQQLAWLTTYRHLFEREGVVIPEQIAKSHELWRSYREQAYRVGAAFAAQVHGFADR
jgi:GMP synthase (glutamine-hydrolysing)